MSDDDIIIEQQADSEADDEQYDFDGEQEGDEQVPAYHEPLRAEPVPVEITSGIYDAFRDDFGDDEAARLRSAWGDKALHNHLVVQTFIGEHPTLDQVYVKNQTEDGGLSAAGVSEGLEYLAEKSGFEDSSALLTAHPELEHLYYDHVDDSGNISPVGVSRMLEYVGKKSGTS